MNDKPFQFFEASDLQEQDLVLSDKLLFKCATDFSHFIETQALEEDKTCTQVLLDYCDMRDLDPEDIAKLVSPSLKGKIEAEMIERGLLPENNTLDVFE